MGTLWQDIRYGLRMLGRNPGFTIVVVAILGIGMGATTVMLGAVDAVLLRPCPYRDSESLVCLYETDGTTHSKTNFTSVATFNDWRERNHVFSDLIAANQRDFGVQCRDGTEKTRAMFVSPGFFSVLGVRPMLGRAFLSQEEQRGGEPVAILSHTHWQRWFGGDPNAIGKTLAVEGRAHTVVGVLPPDFRWIFQSWACGLWMPMSQDPDQGANRGCRGLKAIGRLRQGVSLSQAQAEMDLIGSQIYREYPGAGVDEAVKLVPINRDSARHAGYSGRPRALVIVLGVVASVLLIACLHVASLLIARSAAREHEIAVRSAMGAHRLRLIRQLLTESLLLATLGAMFGLLLASWGIGVLTAFRSEYIPWYGDSAPGRLLPWFTQVHLDGRTLLYMAGVSLATCGLFGSLPAVGASRTHLSRSLSNGRTQAGGPGFQSLRALLVVGDIAIAMVLLTGAGLMVNSYVRIVNIDPGYNPKDILHMAIALDEEKPAYNQPERRLAFFEEAIARIRLIPGVISTTACSGDLVSGTGNVRPFKIEGITYDPGKYRIEGLDHMLPDRSYMWFPYWRVFPDHFQVTQIPLLKGRHFTEQDTMTSKPVAIISDAMVRTFWPDGKPVGQYLVQAPARGGAGPIVREIVGVVGGVKRLGRSEPSDPEIYVPYCQGECPGWMDLLIRTDPTQRGVADAVRREILRMYPETTIDGVGFVDQDISGFFSPQRSIMFCLGGFALVGLVLSCAGVYGATAYAVSRRTHEIGIRMALGARNRDVLSMVLGQGLRLTGIGLLAGVVAALAATRIIRSLLYDVSTTDPLTFVCVSLFLATIAMLACYVPARRAARVNPMVALRHE